MTLVGPVRLKLGDPTAPDFGDFITTITQTAPAPVVLPAINRDYSASPSRGYVITATGVQETLDEGTLWRWLYEHFDEKDVPITWSPLGDGQVWFQGLIASIPDPSVGGAANTHGTFDVSLTLVSRPTIVPNPDGAGTLAEPVDEEPIDEGAEEPVDDGAEEPVDDGAEEPVDDGAEEPVDEGAEEPVDA